MLGVEGISDDILLKAFENAGVTAQKAEKPKDPITKSDLLDLGLVGGQNSARRRAELQKKLGLPERLSANMLLEILNVMYLKEDFMEEVKQWFFRD